VNAAKPAITAVSVCTTVVKIVKVVVERVVMVNHSFTIVGNEDDNRKKAIVIKALDKVSRAIPARQEIMEKLVSTIVANVDVKRKNAVVVKALDKVINTRATLVRQEIMEK